MEGDKLVRKRPIAAEETTESWNFPGKCPFSNRLERVQPLDTLATRGEAGFFYFHGKCRSSCVDSQSGPSQRRDAPIPEEWANVGLVTTGIHP
jgi:hypothetical protein